MCGVVYLSFADGRLPKGEQWLGAAIVQGDTVAEAVKQAWGCVSIRVAK